MTATFVPPSLEELHLACLVEVLAGAANDQAVVTQDAPRIADARMAP